MNINCRISAKKSRFSCQKITFMEFQRFKREHITKTITQRKKMAQVLFSPTVTEEASTLSSEYLQKFFHQGSLFHSVNTIESYKESPVTIKDVVRKVEKKMNKPLLCKLHSNYVCNTHDLTIILSKLIRDKDTEFGYLCKILTHIYSTFSNFVTTEKIHILYSISSSKYAKLDICKKIVERYHSEISNIDVAYSNASNVAKLYYALVSYGTRDEMLYRRLNEQFYLYSTQGIDYVIDTYSENEYEFHDSDDKEVNVDKKGKMERLGIKSADSHANYADKKIISRDFRLVATSMIKAKTFCFDVLKLASNFYAKELESLNNMTDTDPYQVYQLDEKKTIEWEIRDLITILEANETFGYNCRELLETLHKSINSSCNIFEFADIPSLVVIGRKYVTKRGHWKRFLKSKSEDSKFSQLYELYRPDEREYFGDVRISLDLKSGLNKGNNLSSVDSFMETCTKYIKDTGFKDWSIICKMFDLVDHLKRLDLVPIVYSLFREGSLLFVDLSRVIKYLHNLLVHFDDCKEDDLSIITSLDNCARLLSLCIDAENERDYVDLSIFSTLFKLQKFLCAQDRQSFLNSCGTIDHLDDVITKHLNSYSECKRISFTKLPEDLDIFTFMPTPTNHPARCTIDTFKEIIKEIHKDTIAGKNAEIFRFVTHNTFLKMSTL
ncbi:conserved hypothetical protein [Theileria equi strain WA]|uniref:Uncharacterized protein n=1 Tax=Theileria equi strain WA TaxID=1537102 RepID=L1LB28_THEEQ|nr:conserved hypothetical protein [Theileria equi strain WA]EKX72348.1 conserved hypothetical protein [Theileria equi strain WA]|eukprot:XP_004831800.1 conserved hypothetical protein [Theileria equi strain WA]